MADDVYDIIVVGGGPGGYVAAIRASQLGMKVALVEREHLGGICLNWGCIPTKALLRSAEVYRNIIDAEKYGLSVSGVSFDIAKVVERSRKVSKKLSLGVKHLLKKNNVKVIEGYGRLSQPNKLVVEKEPSEVVELKYKNLIIATGARAKTPPGLEPDGKLVWSYKEAMMPKQMPKSILVIGSGAIGIEFASFYSTLGSKVTIVEVLPNILPAEDLEISELAKNAFEAQGIKIVTSSKVLELKRTEKGVEATIETTNDQFAQSFEKVIVAVGIQGNVENLGLEGTNIKLNDGHIETDKFSATAESNIFAIGDVAGPPWLAHKASHEGLICVDNIAGLETHSLSKDRIPGCTYSHPQIASIGLSEKKSLEKGFQIKVGRFPFTGNGKAIALGDSEGLVKTIFDEKTGELLGAHMIGDEVTELIQGYSIASTLETTEVELMETVFPHPTLSEMVHEAVLNAYDRTIHY